MVHLLRYSEMIRARDDLNIAVNNVKMLKRQGIIDEECCTSCVQQLNAVISKLVLQIQQRESTLQELWKTEDEEAEWRKKLDPAEQVLVNQWDSKYQSKITAHTGDNLFDKSKLF